MTIGMTSYVKLAISLPSRAAENVRRAVKAGKAASVSAYIAQAVEEKSKEDSLEHLIAEMLAETGGPLTKAEREWADRAMGFKPKRRTRRRRR
jgi:Arc/MetJ-type ribon-helix-helix transcriptional regulator